MNNLETNGRIEFLCRETETGKYPNEMLWLKQNIGEKMFVGWSQEPSGGERGQGPQKDLEKSQPLKDRCLEQRRGNGTGSLDPEGQHQKE